LLHAFGGSSAAQERSARDLRIVINKNRQILDLYKNGKRIKTYRVCLGLDPDGPKRITGDFRTPEGDYFVCFKSGSSKFHRFLGISYPGERDAQVAFESGLIPLDTRDAIINRVRSGQAPPWDTELGGWVGIHGYPTEEYKKIWISLLFPKPHNWTDGCIALWDFEVEELYSTVSVGTPVMIVP
jgi:murein L,D-transpeptidase YafK